MGVDVDGDERVDRWDHDNDLRRRFDEAERKKEEEAQAKAAAARAAAEKANQDAEGGDDAPASPEPGGAAQDPSKKK